MMHISFESDKLRPFTDKEENNIERRIEYFVENRLYEMR